MRMRLDAARREALNRVNRNVNRRVRYRTDIDLYGKPEFWAIADTEGDCEDVSIRKYKDLRAEGFPRTAFDFATCWVETGEYHAVLIVHTDEGDYVLDNRYPTIKKKDALPYRWHMQTVGARLKEWKLMTKGESNSTGAASVRSVRNNNPGNIEKGDPWQGLAEDQSTDPRFCVFKAPKWGFRALARTLITYYDKHNKKTIKSIIARWAPPSENNTDAYVAAVCRHTKFLPNDVLDLHTYAHMAPLTKAIAIHEAGGWHFSDKDLDEGLRLAGIEPPPKELSESRTIRAAQGGVAGTVGIGVVAETMQTLEPAFSVTRMLGDTWPYLAIGVLLIAIGFMAWARIDDWREARR